MLKLNWRTQYKISNSPFGKKKQEYEIYTNYILGTGGFSTVYRAKCKRTNKEVAIKEIKKETISKGGLLERVNQEINIQAELDHPSILKLYTVFQDHDNIYIVLELCINGELRNFKPFFSEQEVRNILKQIVYGLGYLHSKLVLHRDIKLSNVLLNQDMQVKIADFGLATKLMHPDERHATKCGTLDYISPEVISRKTHGLEVDLWSLGILLYTLLVGKPPFETDTVENTLKRVVFDDYYMPTHLSEPVRNLISRLLQKDPCNRMKLNEVLHHPFLSLDEPPISQKWISNDSGFDTGTGFTSDNISSKFHSLDRKQFYTTSDPYYSCETPKLSRRCRSQERKIPDTQDEIIQICPDNRLYNSKNYRYDAFSCDCSNINKIQEKHNDSYLNKISNGFISSNHSSDVKPSCEMFCENEILNRKSCNCLEFRFKTEQQLISEKYPNYHPLVHIKEKLSDQDWNRQVDRNGVFSKYDERLSSNIATSSESVFSPDTVKIVPFNTDRLKPTRHRNKNVILSILDTGEVCVEFLKHRNKKELVVEVCRITKDGLKMFIYYPNKGQGISPSDTPPPMPLSEADAVFNCQTLSKENWKKYTYASRFVEVVQTKTPKLTMYTEKAKCILMENKPDPDFEILYYEGAKITKSRKGIKLTDNNGLICMLNDTGQEKNSSFREKEHYLYFKKCYEHCRILESKLASASSEIFFKVFPAILGKKPVIKEKDSTWDGRTESPNLFHSTKYAT